MCTDQPGIGGRLTKAPVISRKLDDLQLPHCAACSGHPQPLLQPEGCAHRGQASPRSSRCGGAVSCSSRGLHCLGTDHPPLADKWSNGFSATAWRGGASGAELQNVSAPRIVARRARAVPAAGAPRRRHNFMHPGSWRAPGARPARARREAGRGPAAGRGPPSNTSKSKTQLSAREDTRAWPRSRAAGRSRDG